MKKHGGVEHHMSGRMIADKTVKYILFISAILSIVIVLAIAFFIFRESLQAWAEIGFSDILFKAVWRPGQDQYGILAMVVGSVAVTIGAIVLGVPLALGSAIFLGEIAPKGIQAVLRPAIRAVPDSYRSGSLALGATKWQTITKVVLPAGRSGIMAAIILGVGRALGETMAMIMVIGNSVVFPKPLTANPLTFFFSQARTLTGNIAVEISYATGVHESALFATGVVLFALIILVNASARWLINRQSGIQTTRQG